MKNTIEERMNTLKSEYESGQKMLAELDARRANLTQTLLRIEGAMQVLKELQETEPKPAEDAQALPPAAS
ncbi:hypothetical protein [Archangium lipolyticum]|uniref:hypothetical protein n=1 Tax=Archangium lipolyticum TaxID=2970465 RepID=UPI00214A8AD7|nr:hypothetical protein [Archangium lipolyticum]